MISARPVTTASRVVLRPACAVPDKAAALQQLQASKSVLNTKLAGVEDDLKSEARMETGRPSTSQATSLADIEEINQANYYDKINDADTPVVVVDFYTDWCGPCKLMYPKLKAMKAEFSGQATFYKFNCNKKNKELGISLGVKVAPTFFVYKGAEKAGVITGAKEDELLALIQAHL